MVYFFPWTGQRSADMRLWWDVEAQFGPNQCVRFWQLALWNGCAGFVRQKCGLFIYLFVCLLGDEWGIRGMPTSICAHWLLWLCPSRRTGSRDIANKVFVVLVAFLRAGGECRYGHGVVQKTIIADAPRRGRHAS